MMFADRLLQVSFASIGCYGGRSRFAGWHKHQSQGTTGGSVCEPPDFGSAGASFVFFRLCGVKNIHPIYGILASKRHWNACPLSSECKIDLAD